MINREISLRLAAGRGRCVAQFADAVTRWGGQVPEDPGITELADLLEAAANAAPDHPGGPGHTARTLLAGAVESLRAAARLGGMLPAVTLWHLQRAIDQEHTARQQTVPAPPPVPAHGDWPQACITRACSPPTGVEFTGDEVLDTAVDIVMVTGLVPPREACTPGRPELSLAAVSSASAAMPDERQNLRASADGQRPPPPPNFS
ncbi:hypothetical protein [Streptomyces sp. or3]|uniref:hypothetical protein n=1 Tax=Streptomyces sp. or3 TaxID=1828020 RepID=UPI0015CF7DAE|nr:hypothetical protein [Streptomyces sp. or3]